MHSQSHRIRSVGQTLLTLASIFWPSRRFEHDVQKLVLLGAIVATFLLFTSAYFTPSSWSFLVFAEAIAHGTPVPASAGFAGRALGFPLIALLSGYTITGSIIPLTVIQAVFAILIPIFVYIPIARFSKIVAFYATITTIISLTPYVFMKMIHHDETYMFFTMLMIALLLCYFQTMRLPYLYAFAVAAIAASLTRPAGNLLLPVLLIVGYVYERKRLLHYGTCALVLLGCITFYNWQHNQFFALEAGEVLPSYTGQQIFYGLYINSAEYGIILSEDVGPNMAELGRAVQRYTEPTPSLVASIHNNVNFPQGSVFVKRRIDDLSTAELAREVLSTPCYQYHVLMGQAEPDDRVFMGAALEIAEAYPIYVARYTLRNLLLFLFRPGYAHPVEDSDGNCGPLRRTGLLFYPDYSRIYGNPLETDVGPVMAREVTFVPSLKSRAVKSIYSDLRNIWKAYYNDLMNIVSFFMIMTWIIAIILFIIRLFHLRTLTVFISGAITDSWLPSVIASSALLSYNGLVTAAFAEPDYRYSQMTFPVNILIAGFGAAAGVRLCCLRGGNNEVPSEISDRSHSACIIWALVCFASVALLGSWSAYTFVETH